MSSRRDVMKGLIGGIAALAVQACSGAQRGAQSAFVTAAGFILSNLDAVITGLAPQIPAGTTLSTDLSAAHLSITTAKSLLTVYSDALAGSGNGSCSDLGAAITAAINATLVVIRGLQSAGVTISDTVLVAIEGAGTIVDQIAVSVCGVVTGSGAAAATAGLIRTPVLQTRFSAMGLSWKPIPSNLRCPAI